MSNRSVYSVQKREEKTIGAEKIEDEDAFDAFDDFDEIEEEVVEEPVVEKPTEVKEEEIKKEEIIPEPEEEQEEEIEEEKPEEKETNKPGWCFEDFDGSGTIKPKIYASAAGASNVVVKKPQPKTQSKSSYSSSSSNVDWNKYKDAKAISSDQLFGYDQPTAMEKQRLNQYSNAKAISSDQIFGTETSTSKSSGYSGSSFNSQFDDDDDWGTDDLSRMADTIADGAAKLVAKAKSLFDNF